MAVDVNCSIEIARPPEEVSAYACNPDNAPEWYVNIQSIEWVTDPPLALGSRMAFVARFLGKRLAYTYEVTELEPGHRMVMKTAEGPFPMETTYTFEPVAGGTRMSLRNQGSPSGFSSVMAPIMVRQMKKANEKDLASIKAILEGA